MRIQSFVLKSAALNAGLLLASTAQAGTRAQINVSWEPVSTAIPTLGPWGLALAVLVLGVAAWRVLKSSPQATRLVSVLLLGSGLLVAYEASTEILIAPPLGIFDDDCAGGNLDYFPDPTQTLANTCPNAVRIIEYQYGSDVPECAILVESCPEGTRLEAETGVCTLNYYNFMACES